MTPTQDCASNYYASAQACLKDISGVISESKICKTLEKHKDVIVISMQLAIDFYSLKTEPFIFAASFLTVLIKPDFSASVFMKVKKAWEDNPNNRQFLSLAAISTVVYFPTETQAVVCGTFTAKLLQKPSEELNQSDWKFRLSNFFWRSKTD